MKTIKLNAEGMYRVTNGTSSIDVKKMRANYWIVGCKLNGIYRTKSDAVIEAINKLSK